MNEVEAAIRESGVVGIVRSRSAQEAVRAATALLKGGLPAVEISLVTPDAIDAIRDVVDLGIGFVGAGTVLDEPSAVAAIRVGARFVVAPTLNPAVIATARRYGAASLPGVATPTEALRALELGASFAKLFPASAYGPRAITDMLSALPQIPLVPAGGIGLEDAADYIRAGSLAVGMGSALSRGADHDVAVRVAQLKESIAAAR